MSLRNTADWLEAVVEGSRDAIFISDASGRFILVNRAACELTGHPRERLLEMLIPDLHEDSDLEAYRRYHKAILEGMEAVTEARVLRSDGSKVDVEFNNRRIEIDGQHYIHTVARDITARRESERERSRMLARMEALIESIHGAILVEGLDHRIVRVNTRFCELFSPHAGPQALVGLDARESARSLEDLFVPTTGLQAGIEARIAAGEPVRGEELEMVDGRRLERDYVPILGADGRITGHLWHYRDVTARELREARLRRIDQLESVGQLTAGIAHDFNNLLTVIGANTELLERHVDHTAEARTDDDNDAEGPELLADLQASVASARALVRKLLTFSRQVPLDRAPLELTRLVAEELRTLRRVIRSNIDIEMDLDSDVPPVMADAGSLQQILLNLVTNAQDAMPDGGTIRVGVRTRSPGADDPGDRNGTRPGAYVRLTVSDTGVGMDEEMQGNIFEPFFTTKDRSKGTGLGLAMVYGLVRDHGGRIDVASRPGAGTTMTVDLPVADRGVAAAADARVGTEAPRGDATLLLVEDDDALRATALRTLGRLGYRVLAAEDGARALEINDAHTEEIDLLLTDWMMPGMTGIELIQRLREARPELRCMLSSGYPPDEHDWDTTWPDAVTFLQKPWTISELAQTVRDALVGAPTPD